MQESRLTAGRSCPVRLVDVPLKLRRRFGWILVEQATLDGNLLEAVALKAAIEYPSDRVYWVSAEAVEKVLG